MLGRILTYDLHSLVCFVVVFWHEAKVSVASGPLEATFSGYFDITKIAQPIVISLEVHLAVRVLLRDGYECWLLTFLLHTQDMTSETARLASNLEFEYVSELPFLLFILSMFLHIFSPIFLCFYLIKFDFIRSLFDII